MWQWAAAIAAEWSIQARQIATAYWAANSVERLARSALNSRGPANSPASWYATKEPRQFNSGMCAATAASSGV